MPHFLLLFDIISVFENHKHIMKVNVAGIRIKTSPLAMHYIYIYIDKSLDNNWHNVYYLIPDML